jgi:hypothetical protein
MKVTFTLSIGFQGKHTDTFEYEDDVTDEELDRDWAEWSQNYIDGGFERESESE